MNAERTANAVGFGLLITVFAISLWNVFGRTAREHSSEHVIIRIAHWRLEEPTIAGYQAVADAYMERNPGVIVEQITVPLRIWPMWIRSRMTGDNPPDLVNYHPGFIDDLNLARHFIPMGEYLEEPNPYNQGTALEGVPWRKTFHGDLTVRPSFNDILIEFYAIPTAVNTMRLFINRDLLERIDGPEARLPTDFREFLELSGRTRAYAEKEMLALVPLAGSRDRSRPAMTRLFHGLTQKIMEKSNWNYDIEAGFRNGDAYFGYIDGHWTLESPEFRSALEAVRAFNLTQDRGFLQRMQDEATFKFLQGRALMVPVFAIDAQNLVDLAEFEVDILGQIPLPERGDPLYGAGTYGTLAESAEDVSIPFVVSRSSRHFDAALDFLRFLTSYDGSRLFTSVSQYLSPIDGVPPPRGKEAFTHVRDGYPPGIDFVEIPVIPDLTQLILANLHVLTEKDGGVDAFIAAIEKSFLKDLEQDLRRNSKRRRAGNRRTDSLIAAYSDAAEGHDVKRFQTLVGKQNAEEARNYRILYYLDRDDSG